MSKWSSGYELGQLNRRVLWIVLGRYFHSGVGRVHWEIAGRYWLEVTQARGSLGAREFAKAAEAGYRAPVEAGGVTRSQLAQVLSHTRAITSWIRSRQVRERKGEDVNLEWRAESLGRVTAILRHPLDHWVMR